MGLSNEAVPFDYSIHVSEVDCCEQILPPECHILFILPRPFAGNRAGLEKLCSASQTKMLASAMQESFAAFKKCPICTINTLDHDSELRICWTPDFSKFRWRLGKVAPCCKSCAKVGSLETVLNEMLSVEDEESESEFSKLASHFQVVNRADQHAFQLALNLSHAAKTLARWSLHPFITPSRRIFS
jgi:hypothetical protein